MSIPLTLREAEPSDWPAIWPIVESVVRAGDTFSVDQSMSPEQARSWWMHTSPTDPGHTYVAEDPSGVILGTATLYPNHGGPASHVANASFMVAADAAGNGVGRALGQHVLEQAKLDGYRSMQFNAVVEANTRAVALWQSLGFEILTTIPEGFHHPRAGYVGLHIMFRWL